VIAGLPFLSLAPTALAASAAAGTPDSGEPTITLMRIFVVLVGASALLTLLAGRIRLPYTVALVAFGIVAGALVPSPRFALTPQLVLAVLLPALIFEASYHIDFDRLRPSLVDVSLLAGPGVLVSAAFVALFLNLGAGLPPTEAFIVGAMLAATDPVAVIATFDRLGSPRRLATLVEAESLFNDGTGIVAFSIALSFLETPVPPWQMGLSFVGVVMLSAGLGAITGLATSLLLRHVDDHLIEISLSVVLAYGVYLVADALGLSGVIATAVAGILLGNYGRGVAMSETTRQALETVWEFAAFLATAFAFVLIGFAITFDQLAAAAAAIAWAVVAVLVARALIVYGFLGPLRLLRVRLRTAEDEEEEEDAEAAAAANPASAPATTWREGEMPAVWLNVIYWAGLRGAVSTALALALPEDLPDRSVLQGVTLGVVLFTLLVQATTAGRVVERWGRRRPRRLREVLVPVEERASKGGQPAPVDRAPAGPRTGASEARPKPGPKARPSGSKPPAGRKSPKPGPKARPSGSKPPESSSGARSRSTRVPGRSP
jgi:CPA1 family monovalent cation:H+ antiporter